MVAHFMFLFQMESQRRLVIFQGYALAWPVLLVEEGERKSKVYVPSEEYV